MAFKNVSTTRPMGKSALRNVELRKQMALMLQKEGMETLPSGNMAGRVFAPTTALQGLGKVANVGVGVLGQYLAGKRGQEIDDDRSQDRIDRVGAYLSDMKNTPEVAGSPETNVIPPQGVQGSETNPYIPASGEFKEAVAEQPAIAGLSRQDSAMKNLFTSDNPEMQELAMKMITGTNKNNQTANMMDWDQWKSMTPEEQTSYRLMKTGINETNYGGFVARPQIGGGVTDIVQKTISPDNSPKLKGEQTTEIENAKLVTKEIEDKRQKDLQQTNFFAQIDKAETLLGLDPTASGFGTMVDDVTGYFGGAFDSADVAESLRGVEAWMTSNVPRMEGPQSDNDIKMYKQMAAVIGDSTIPVSRRKAALNTLKDLQKKYITGYYHPKFGGTRPNTPNANTNAGNQPSPANANAGKQPSPSNGETIEYFRDPKTNKLLRKP